MQTTDTGNNMKLISKCCAEWKNNEYKRAHTVGFHSHEVLGKTKQTVKEEIKTVAGSDEKDVQKSTNMGMKILLEDGSVLYFIGMQHMDGMHLSKQTQLYT